MIGKKLDPLLRSQSTNKLKGADATDSKCNFCTHSRCIPETRWEPAEYYCSAESDNYGTDDGCWMFEDAEDVAGCQGDGFLDNFFDTFV